MSVERAKKALAGEATDCIPLFDMPTHPGFLRKLTGLDPFERTTEAVARAVRQLDIDMLAGELPQQTEANESHRDLYDIHATTWRDATSTRKDIFSYDPAVDRDGQIANINDAEYTRRLQGKLDRDRQLVGDVALMIGYTYTTCFHYAAEDLDWEEFLIACSCGDDRVFSLLDRFQAASEKTFRAWADTDIEIMFSHDDIAMATGPVMNPDWLRKNIISRYPRIWQPMKDSGRKILFATDGDFDCFAADLVEAGADGFFLDSPCADLERLVSQCGRDLIYFTGPSPATMTVGRRQDVRDEVGRLAEIGKELPGFFFHMVGGYPHNMPVENVIAFYESCRELGSR